MGGAECGESRRCWASLWPFAWPLHYVRTEEKNFGKGRLAMVERSGISTLVALEAGRAAAARASL